MLTRRLDVEYGLAPRWEFRPMGTEAEQKIAAMIPVQRRKLILDVIYDQGAASVQQLSERAGASVATIRRDLDQLASEQLIRRSRGGASIVDFAAPPTASGASQPIDVERVRGNPDKRALGIAAGERIEDGQHVIFDSGLACDEAARRVVERQLSITAITNSIKVASILAKSDLVKLVVIGGTRKSGTFTLVGDPGIEFLRGLHVDIAIISAQAISKGRLSHTSLEIVSLKRRMIEAAQYTILPAESWKFGGPAFCDICSLGEIDEVIADEGISAADRDIIAAHGARLRIVGGASSHDSAPPLADNDWY